MSQTHKELDVIVEMLADVNLDKDLELVAPGGRIAVSSHLYAACSITLFSLSNSASGKEVTKFNVLHKPIVIFLYIAACEQEPEQPLLSPIKLERLTI